jgi:hypothetical protein
MVGFTCNLVNRAKERRVKHMIKLSYIRADPKVEPQIDVYSLVGGSQLPVQYS